MYRVGICDDDRLFCSQTEEMILSLSEELSEKMETEVWFSGESLMQSLSGDLCAEAPPDILFLDIELYENSGIDVGRFIREGGNYTTHIVYVSSRQEYAMQLFRIQPIDFLIKPVSREQLREVLERSMRQNATEKSLFEYQKSGTFYKIPCSEILYFMSINKKICIITETETHEFYGKLKAIADRLPGQFLAIHQSYIINRDGVSEYSYETVQMKNGDTLNISKPYRRDVRSKIVQYEKARLRVGGN